MEFSDKIQALCNLIIDSSEKHILKKAVFSKPTSKDVLRTVLTLREISGREVLQAEIFTRDNKALHKNIERDNFDAICELCLDYMQVNLITTAGDCEYRRSRSGNEVIIGANKLSYDGAEKVASVGNNNEKKYILSGNEPFLKLLGVSDERGRVKDKKTAKFRQINRFLEMIRDCQGSLPEGKIRICDLCCGKSYLSFAVYHYFANILGYEVSMTGVDLKADVIEYCSSVAKELDFGGLEFICGDINLYNTDLLPDLVISLHACDIATDIVLNKAVEWGTKVILSTPCCHHELNHKINCEALSFIAEYSMLRQKLCDAATDALRLKLLEANGYSCDALELIDPEETPKNIMLRAIRKNNKNSAKAIAAMAEYQRARVFLLGE